MRRMESVARRCRVRGGGPVSTRAVISLGVRTKTTVFAQTAATKSCGCAVVLFAVVASTEWGVASQFVGLQHPELAPSAAVLARA